MAGLYVKELTLRGGVARCLVVAPGALVEQWQEELAEKFGLRFELLTRQLVDATVDGNVFERHPMLIARMDQLSRSEDLMTRLMTGGLPPHPQRGAVRQELRRPLPAGPRPGVGGGPERGRGAVPADPFAGFEFVDFAATGLRGDWTEMWSRGRPPF